MPPYSTNAVCCPGTARLCGFALESRRGWIRWPSANATVACLLVVRAAYLVITHPHGWAERMGIRHSLTFPVCAVDFVQRHDLTGHAFLEYNLSGFVVWSLYPAVQVNMHLVDYVFGQQLYDEFAAIQRDPEAMQAYLRRYPVDFFLLSKSWHRAVDALIAMGEWALVHVDDLHLVLVRRSPQHAALIAREGYQRLKAQPQLSVTSDTAAQILDEAERSMRHCPQWSAAAWSYKANALHALGRQEE
jgi:hypothetical protein